MSDRMTCLPFSQLLKWVFEEQKKHGAVFGVHTPYKTGAGEKPVIFDRKLETVIGPAAGPQTQLAQNLIAAYYAGGRFFEIKTVQKLDGEDLKVTKPCILADDEGYNIEWSTELTVQDAQDEYIKAWVMLHLMAKEFDLGSQDGFQFNMSVGYDLAGIKTEKLDNFINTMIDASNAESFKGSIADAKANLNLFQKVTAKDIDAIPSAICNSATISTLHGCPPNEIESIANYLIEEKHLHTFVKCNPTLLGYDFARETMDKMGYDYLAFGRFHFDDDLQYKDAIPMFKRLKKLAESKNLTFGLKLTNTFPVDIKRNELAGEEMYMSGKALYPLTIALAARISKDMDGQLRIAYSGGADAFNIGQIVSAGIWPVTMATTLLKPGGYQRLRQLAEMLDKQGVKPFTGVDTAAVEKMANEAITHPHFRKTIKFPVSRKHAAKVPLVDCFVAGCEETCPINQDIPNYIQLAGEGKYREALEVILDKNALPFITGTICAHPCMSACVRNVYEETVRIRDVKLEAATRGFDEAIKNLKAETSLGKKVAIIGGGPAGMSAAFYLARAGAKVTLFEKRSALGGVVRWAIPDFRIDADQIEKDVALLKQLNVEIRTGENVEDVKALKAQGYDAVIVAIGAYKPGMITFTGIEPLNAIDFLEAFNRTKGDVKLGENVVVIGGGNTAMDVARAAKANHGVKSVTIAYRRTLRYMPAEEEEIRMALDDGIVIRELLAPEKWENNQLTCRVMAQGALDASNRPGVVETDELVNLPCTTVIVAVGEQLPKDYYEANGIKVDSKGRPVVDAKTYETNVPGVYVSGDGLFGPSTIVEAEANSTRIAKAILAKPVTSKISKAKDLKPLYAKRGILIPEVAAKHENERCLSCSTVCEICVEVCPNRANLSIKVPGKQQAQIVHYDPACNECGNCETFCPYSSAPYKDKFTYFANEKDMAESKNKGFVVLDPVKNIFKVRLFGTETTVSEHEPGRVPPVLIDVMKSFVKDYAYLLVK